MFENQDRNQWQKLVLEEVLFWNAFLKSRGGSWPEAFAARTTLRHLQPHFKFLLPDLEEVRILDVGAGPLSSVGTILPGKQVHLTPIDALAVEYDSLLEKYALTPPVRTVLCDAEALTDIFPDNHFHIVHANNAIDHCYSPLLAIQQMVRVVKPQCWIYLRHRRNEGETQKYNGLHQWNFDVGEDGSFILWNQKIKLCVKDALDGVAINCRLECEADQLTNAPWVIVEIRKNDR